MKTSLSTGFVPMTPRELSLLEGRVIHLYEPDLGSFVQLCTNWLSLQRQRIIDRDIMILSLESWTYYCRSFLSCYCRLQLRELYVLKNRMTESPSKLLNLVFGDVEVPRYLVDICREVCRPMVSGRHVYIPWIWPLVGGSTPGLKSLGLGVAQSIQVMNFLRAIPDLDSRRVVDEGILSSPLSVRDGEFHFVDPAISTWRRKAWYNLCHFINGAIEPENNNPYELGEPWVPTRSSFRDEPEWNVVPFWTLSPGVDIRVEDIQFVAFAILAGVPYRSLGVSRHWLFIGVDRQRLYNDWFTKEHCAGSCLPPPDLRRVELQFDVGESQRFPTDDTHSKTPPQSPIRMEVVSKGRKRRPPPKEG